MSRSSEPQPAEIEGGDEAGLTLGQWAASRATILIAVAVLLTLLAILIVISLLHTR